MTHEPRAAAVAGQLISSSAYHRALLEAVLDPTLAIDAHGTIVLASASVERVFGWTPEDLAGRNINVLMPEPHHSAHDGYLARYRETGVTHILGRTRQFEVVHKSGRRLVCDLSVARVDLPNGAPPVFIGSLRDMTERKDADDALAASERRFRAIFDRSYQYMGLLAPDGTLLEVNQTALDVIGAARESVVGRKFWDTPWWPRESDGHERVKRAVGAAARGEFVRFETEFCGSDGQSLSIDFSMTPVHGAGGTVELLIPAGHNVTELKRAQRAETAMLRALATLGESSAMLAHEIKNPITAVNLALRAVAKQLGEDEREVLADLVARMQRLEALMRRTLTFARPLELRRETLGAASVARGVLVELAPEIERRGVDVRVECAEELKLRADGQLLHEVLANLVRNALEARAGRVRIVIAQDDGERVLTVDDDGPGIAPERRESLFQPFRSTKPGGTGLGLAFCRKVLAEHGGSLTVGDSPLGGARFELRLPGKPR